MPVTDLSNAKWMKEGGEVVVKVMPLGITDLTQTWVFEAEGCAILERRMSLNDTMTRLESETGKKFTQHERLKISLKDYLQKMLDDAYLASNLVPPQITHVKIIECEMTPKASA